MGDPRKNRGGGRRVRIRKPKGEYRRAGLRGGLPHPGGVKVFCVRFVLQGEHMKHRAGCFFSLQTVLLQCLCGCEELFQLRVA